MAGNAGNLPPLIIKRVKKGGHGGAHGNTTWKIALADFMTAMFIIFLLLWLISQTTPEQKAGIADYFAPASASRSTNGSGGVMGGRVIAQPDHGSRLDELYRIIFQRLPTDGERETLAKFLTRYSQAVADSPAADQPLTLWSACSRVLLSTNQFLYVE